MHKYIQREYNLFWLVLNLGDLQKLASVTSDGLEVRGRSLTFWYWRICRDQNNTNVVFN